MTVSVILTSYNRPNMVCRAIESVLAQDYHDWELIIVDDSSDHKTIKAIESYYDERIKVLVADVEEENRLQKCRYSVNINWGIRESSGEYITYLTDDDYYLPHRLRVMVNRIEDDDIRIVYGKQRVINKTNGRSYIRSLRGVTDRPMSFVDHNSFMHERSCLDKVEEPWWPEDKMFWGAADAAFFKKLVEYWKFYPIRVVTDVHVIHDGGIQEMMRSGLTPTGEPR